MDFITWAFLAFAVYPMTAFCGIVLLIFLLPKGPIMAKTLSRKDLNRLLKGFESQGATIKECADGYRVLPPNGGKPLTIHLTLSDVRGMKNLRADARRVDLDWPLD